MKNKNKRMSSEEKQGSKSNDYLKLKPSATFLDLFLFTLSFNLGNINNLVDCPPGKQGSYKSFGDRWIIVSSIFLQKLILPVATLVQSSKKIAVETFGLHPKIYTPKVKCRDWRIEKGNTDFSYYSSLSMMASTLAYEDSSVVETVVQDCWQMNLLNFYEFWNDFQGKASTQAFTFQNTATDPNVTVVAFRGTSEIDDWLVNVNCSWYNIKGIGNIHYGFMQALGLQMDTNDWPNDLPPRPNPNTDQLFAYYTLRQQLKDIAKTNANAQFIITGHSLGGALATLFVTVLAFHGEDSLLEKVQAVYTFGQPKVGDRQFAQYMESITKRYGFKYYRCVYSFDLVSRVPFDIKETWYRHFGGCVFYNCFYKGKFLEDKPNKHNYLFVILFEILIIPSKYLTAWWELIRSLVIPIFKGRDYFEGFSSLLFRVFGLLLPGASAHMCLNYINSTRYAGKIQQLFKHLKP